jgi:hypothetical protein
MHLISEHQYIVWFLLMLMCLIEHLLLVHGVPHAHITDVFDSLLNFIAPSYQLQLIWNIGSISDFGLGGKLYQI